MRGCLLFIHTQSLHHGCCVRLQLSTSDELEGKFAQLEGDDVDAELSAMKKGLLSGSSSKSKQSLPEGRSDGRPYK